MHGAAAAAPAKPAKEIQKRPSGLYPPGANVHVGASPPKCPGKNGGSIIWQRGKHISKVSFSSSKGGWRVWKNKDVVSQEKLIKGDEADWPEVIKFLKGV